MGNDDRFPSALRRPKRTGDASENRSPFPFARLSSKSFSTKTTRFQSFPHASTIPTFPFVSVFAKYRTHLRNVRDFRPSLHPRRVRASAHARLTLRERSVRTDETSPENPVRFDFRPFFRQGKPCFRTKSARSTFSVSVRLPTGRAAKRRAVPRFDRSRNVESTYENLARLESDRFPSISLASLALPSGGEAFIRERRSSPFPFSSARAKPVSAGFVVGLRSLVMHAVAVGFFPFLDC